MTCPNSLLSSNSLLVVSLGFSRYDIMSSANNFFFLSFTDSVQKCSQLQCIDFIACNFTKLTDELYQFSGIVFRISRYSITSSANSDDFTSSFPTQIPFVSFSFSDFPGQDFQNYAELYQESTPPCLVPALSFSPLRMMSAVGSTYTAFIILMQLPRCHLSEVFLSEMGVGSCQRVFVHLSRGSYVLVFFSF